MNKWQRFDTTVFTVSPKDFGKDIMQNTFELPDGGAVTLSGAGCTVETGDGIAAK